MAKPNLPVVIFLQVLVTQVIAWVGKSFLQDVAFNAYSKFVLGANAKKQRELRKQVLLDKAELQKTSSQDEFAKWARLKRKVDKGLEQLEKESEYLLVAASRTESSSQHRWNGKTWEPYKQAGSLMVSNATVRSTRWRHATCFVVARWRLPTSSCVVDRLPSTWAASSCQRRGR